jgi:hypothetical protein
MLKKLWIVGYAATLARWLKCPLQLSPEFPGVRLRLGVFITPWSKLFHNFCSFWLPRMLGVIVPELDNIR